MSFARRERGGVVIVSGRDHLSAQGWWIFMALLGGGGAFLALDPLGPAITAGIVVGAVVLCFLGQLTGRFALRLEAEGPVLSYRLLGLPWRRWVLPKAVRARVMGLGDHGDTGADGGNVAVELYLEQALLDELWVGPRSGAHELAALLQRELRARYGDAPERVERMAANLPWLLRGIGWLQRGSGFFKPTIEREGGRLTIDFPCEGIDADPREASLWVVIAGLSVLALPLTLLLERSLGSWIAGAVFALSAGILAWRAGRSLRLERGPEGAFLIRRRFGLATWHLPIELERRNLLYAWWCGHPSGIAFEGPEGEDGLELDRLKFGPLACASAWPWLPPLEDVLGAPERTVSRPDGGRAPTRRRRRGRR